MDYYRSSTIQKDRIPYGDVAPEYWRRQYKYEEDHRDWTGSAGTLIFSVHDRGINATKVADTGFSSRGYMFAGRSFRSKMDAVTSLGISRITLTYPYFTDVPTSIDASALANEVASNIELVGFIENTGRSFGQYRIEAAKITFG